MSMKKNLYLTVFVLFLGFSFIAFPRNRGGESHSQTQLGSGRGSLFYFVAKEKGFYKEKGLDVNIERGQDPAIR